ncbi:MAG: YceI family protein [Lentisphaeria bacterium]|nr:YceI family protein [Lentisphaeria bacterium]NQZ67868.1 YceI family protein [Lentisphaeria bacterium]
MKKLTLVIAFIAALSLSANDFKVDSVHSSIGFSVKHLLISNVKGNFKKFSGSWSYDEKTKSIKSFKLMIETASIDTDNVSGDCFTVLL